MITQLVLAALLAATGIGDAGTINVYPSSIAITDLRPGTTGAVDITVTNTSSRAVQVSVTGDLRASELAGEEDLLQVVLAGCAQSWTGVPEAPVAGKPATRCPSGEVPASSGSLAAVPLEAGQTLHLLISAGLGEHAGNGAQGQSWAATFDVLALSDEPPVDAPLAITGSNSGAVAAAAGALIVAGAAVVRGRRTRLRKDVTR